MALNSAINATANSNIEVYLKIAELALLWQIVDFVAFYRIPESIFQ